MRCGRWTIWAALAASVISGCGKSEGESPVAESPASQQQSTEESKSGPAEAVHTFLKAVQEGKDEDANNMLTKLAREETAKMNMVVAPPGSETATFEVGEVELLVEGDERGAHVASTWTDVGDDGQPHTDEIVWMLRKEPDGWRIAGMATKIFEDEPALLLNFEDPQDMQRKQQLAEQEMQRRMRAELDAEFSADKSAEAGQERPERQAQRGGAVSETTRE